MSPFTYVPFDPFSFLPAQAHEQGMVRFRPVLDTAQQAHGRVSGEIVLKINRIQIFHRYPPENSPRKKRTHTRSVTVRLIEQSRQQRNKCAHPEESQTTARCSCVTVYLHVKFRGLKSRLNTADGHETKITWLSRDP